MLAAAGGVLLDPAIGTKLRIRELRASARATQLRGARAQSGVPARARALHHKLPPEAKPESAVKGGLLGRTQAFHHE